MIRSMRKLFQPASDLAAGVRRSQLKEAAECFLSLRTRLSDAAGVPATRLPASSARDGDTERVTGAGMRRRSKVLASLGEGGVAAIVSAHDARGLPPNQALQTTPTFTPVLLFFDSLVRRV